MYESLLLITVSGNPGRIMFIEACWLINSELQGTEIPVQDNLGFANIMHGALRDEIGNFCELKGFWLKLNSDGLDSAPPATPYIYLPRQL